MLCHRLVYPLFPDFSRQLSSLALVYNSKVVLGGINFGQDYYQGIIYSSLMCFTMRKVGFQFNDMWKGHCICR